MMKKKTQLFIFFSFRVALCCFFSLSLFFPYFIQKIKSACKYYHLFSYRFFKKKKKRERKRNMKKERKTPLFFFYIILFLLPKEERKKGGSFFSLSFLQNLFS